MPLYQATYIDNSTGRTMKAKVEAPSANSLRLMVTERGGVLRDFKEVVGSTAKKSARFGQVHLIRIFDQLCLMTESGVFFDSAIKQLMTDYHDSRVKNVLRGIHYEVSVNKKSISEAFACYPKAFPEDIVSIIRVGEGSGKLAPRFADISRQVDFRLGIRKMATKAMLYPIGVGLISIIVAIVMLVFVIPQIKEFFSQMELELPLATRILIGSSDFFLDNAVLLSSMGILTVLATVTLRRIKTTRLWFARMLLKLPGLGNIIVNLTVSEVTKIYQTLYTAEVKIGEALHSCALILRNSFLKQRMLSVEKQVLNSTVPVLRPDDPSLTAAFRATGYFPPMVLSVISTGERAGSLSQSLSKASEYYQKMAEESIAKLFVTIQTVIFVLMSISTVFIVFSLYYPILKAVESLM